MVSLDRKASGDDLERCNGRSKEPSQESVDSDPNRGDFAKLDFGLGELGQQEPSDGCQDQHDDGDVGDLGSEEAGCEVEDPGSSTFCGGQEDTQGLHEVEVSESNGGGDSSVDIIGSGFGNGQGALERT